ncbi:hypothetical protein N9468_04600, partial [Flavobacteriaceae bacterium]|nr:hypothetical protein [Flavobacteriaceae bacterium]
HLQVTEDFVAAGTLDFRLESGTDGVTFGTTLVAADAIAVTTLVAGYELIPGYTFLANDANRYIRLEFDVNTNAFTSGKLWGGVIVDKQSNG